VRVGAFGAERVVSVLPAAVPLLLPAARAAVPAAPVDQPRARLAG
jgi:hypothetical protein